MGIHNNSGDKISTREITIEEVAKVAKTSKLDLRGDELESMRVSLNGIMEHIGKLNEVDTVGVPPFDHSYTTASSCDSIDGSVGAGAAKNNGSGENSQRLGVDAMLSNAPKSRDGYYQVPRVIES